MLDVTKRFAAATVLALAGQVASAQDASQTDPLPGQAGAPAKPGASAPAPVPAPAPQAGAPQQGAQQTLSEEQKSALGAVWAYTQVLKGVADVAASRASSEEVKNLARLISADQKGLGEQLTARVQERGGSTSSLPAPADRQTLDQEAQQLGLRTGEDFDRAFVAFVKQRGPQFVEALKRARDVTAGRDAALKKYLDQAEDSGENYLAAARQLDARRQARTPPKR